VNIKAMLKKISTVVVPSILATMPMYAHAAGYKMEFQSVSVMGGGGDAAVLEDAGTNWYNSAGDVYMPKQLVFSSFEVYIPTTFTGTATAPSPYDAVLPHPPFPLYSYQSGLGSASAHTSTFIPSFHATYPLSERYAVGLSVVPAWGFREDYGSHSMLRYTLQSIYTRTFDIEPSLAIKLNNQWSIGLGPDFNYFTVQSEASARTEGPVPPFVPPGVPAGTAGDSIQRFTGEQWKTGWHVGILLRQSDTTRIGLNYRSPIIMDLKGDSSLAIFNGPTVTSSDFSISVPMPAVTTLSIYHELSPIFALTGSIFYDQWSINNAYHGKSIVTLASDGTPTTTNVDIDQNFRNTVDFSVGAHLKLTEKLMLRSLIKYVATPTNNQDRDVNFPDAPKLGFHFGSRYQMTKNVALDLIYGHAFVWQEPIYSTNPLTGATANGHVRSHVDFAGGQFVINI
jgi:long-chain fatty acid transport protein